MAEALSGKISEAISSPYNPGDGAAEESVGISIGIAFSLLMESIMNS